MLHLFFVHGGQDGLPLTVKNLGKQVLKHVMTIFGWHFSWWRGRSLTKVWVYSPTANK